MKRSSTTSDDLGSEDIGFSVRRGELGSGPIVIVGAGLAGLFTALKLAPLPVTVVSAAPLGTGAASAWAQGGIAAAVGKGDTAQAHANDTIAAGAGLVDPNIAMAVANEAAARVYDLLELGVPFDRTEDGEFALSREAAHGENRIVRVSGDKAGAAIMQALVAKVRATSSISVLEGYNLEDLIISEGRVSGVRLARKVDLGIAYHEISSASAVVLATGGIGAMFSVTTNPRYSRGISLAIAARAGAVISDAEFVQFHPTALDFDIDPAPLATESLRGEGALLINGRGERFMFGLHADGELAPRDIVARGVYSQNRSGLGAFLDCREALGDEFAARFPTVFASCQRAGFDPASQPLPIVTAAHYHMGGIATDGHARSSVAGLWAIGEVAATGLHGANRLASNSLLETLVFGARAALDISAVVGPDVAGAPTPTLTRTGQNWSELSDDAALDSIVRRLRKIMSAHVGVVREASGLRRAVRELGAIEDAFGGSQLIANMALAARVVASAALLREESRGAQFRSDFPNESMQGAARSFLTLADIEGVRAPLERTPAMPGLIEAKNVAASPA